MGGSVAPEGAKLSPCLDPNANVSIEEHSTTYTWTTSHPFPAIGFVPFVTNIVPPGTIS
jgi:hypothetical protein